ncbi:MAG: hypothetical protein VYA34_01010 [Myxococcota bacterium]|nr:hypothetical protein [Myxococcota bacterium]
MSLSTLAIESKANLECSDAPALDTADEVIGLNRPPSKSLLSVGHRPPFQHPY